MIDPDQRASVGKRHRPLTRWADRDRPRRSGPVLPPPEARLSPWVDREGTAALDPL